MWFLLFAAELAARRALGALARFLRPGPDAPPFKVPFRLPGPAPEDSTVILRAYHVAPDWSSAQVRRWWR